MGQYTQQYREATSGTPKVYPTIIRTDYMQIQGKIALFRTMQSQTPAKAALKETDKVQQAILFVNDIPGMYAWELRIRSGTPFPNLHKKRFKKIATFSNSAGTASHQHQHLNKNTNSRFWKPSAR